MTTREPVDSLGMFNAALGLPEQIEAAVVVARAATDLPSAEGLTNVVVLGMGGSGIAGDVLAATAGPFMPLPIVVSKQYEPPTFVDHRSLVLASSFSGNTEETLAAAEAAATAGARLVVVSAGGQLEQLARHWHAPHLRLDPAIPMPRAALGAAVALPLVALERMGLLHGATDYLGRAVEQLRNRRDEVAGAEGPAARLAGRIGRTFPLVYGGGPIGAVAAQRWKGQFNENVKIPAFANSFPELTHNEICGWGQHGDITRQLVTLVLLRHDHEHPQVMRRFEMVAEMLDEVVAGVETVEAAGDGELAQFFDLVIQGDLVSLHLAAQEGIDPGPVPVLDEVKAALRS